jgi:acyl-CoA thioester hydrolase
MKPRKKKEYFERIPGAPEPVVYEVKRRSRFSEVDAMAIVWHGRYATFFEEASAELGRTVGLSYKDFFDAGLRAPIVELHIDYYMPLYLDEEFTTRASLVWHDGSRINTEYHLIKRDGGLAASGYMVQLLVDAGTGEPLYVSPELLVRCREKWKAGAFR